eukprot:CAMPEP_0175050374 /NCGR_PEP_ID=MMETSP0052_2-20121109/7227_1 /TAXON_ID=51329 ORGANISM="Polytomella parva, Strain SAG 63-3" /NCGR_SAMPLE_ID=MMETSP0052_2 /ASSEMBLY_ACC=CAM_ASM_000194 /LENGTH=569 /DNA_ID=CAMNT_0016314577 /DNA_START=718 /DNA_END=2423 /DNA_ORIENTATION=+
MSLPAYDFDESLSAFINSTSSQLSSMTPNSTNFPQFPRGGVVTHRPNSNDISIPLSPASTSPASPFVAPACRAESSLSFSAQHQAAMLRLQHGFDIREMSMLTSGTGPTGGRIGEGVGVGVGVGVGNGSGNGNGLNGLNGVYNNNLGLENTVVPSLLSPLHHPHVSTMSTSAPHHSVPSLSPLSLPVPSALLSTSSSVNHPLPDILSDSALTSFGHHNNLSLSLSNGILSSSSNSNNGNHATNGNISPSHYHSNSNISPSHHHSSINISPSHLGPPPHLSSSSPTQISPSNPSMSKSMLNGVSSSLSQRPPTPSAKEEDIVMPLKHLSPNRRRTRFAGASPPPDRYGVTSSSGIANSSHSHSNLNIVLDSVLNSNGNGSASFSSTSSPFMNVGNLSQETTGLLEVNDFGTGELLSPHATAPMPSQSAPHATGSNVSNISNNLGISNNLSTSNSFSNSIAGSSTSTFPAHGRRSCLSPSISFSGEGPGSGSHFPTILSGLSLSSLSHLPILDDVLLDTIGAAGLMNVGGGGGSSGSRRISSGGDHLFRDHLLNAALNNPGSGGGSGGGSG